MPTITESEIQTMQREIQGRLRAGDLEAAIQIQRRLVDMLMEVGPKGLQSQSALAESLERAASQLVDSLRWSRQYEQAIALQESLVEFLPEMKVALQLGIANLKVEGGEEEAGLAQLHDMVTLEPDNYWFQISLASSLLFLDRFTEAETVLKQAVDMTHVRKIDRALAYEYLFWLHNYQERTEEALAAWREAARLDHNLRSELLPEVCRMLIYQHKYLDANKYIAQITNQAQRLLFQGLVSFMNNNPTDAAVNWHQALNSINPASLKTGQDAYAEICIRMANPTAAIKVLEPLVEEGKVNFERMTLIGLANAQKGNLERARTNLGVALRLGDLERPRKTKSSLHGRIFNRFGGLLYASIPIHPSIRKEIDSFFLE